MAFSIIGVVNATELLLGTLCYSSRSPSSSIAGSAPTSLPDFMRRELGTMPRKTALSPLASSPGHRKVLKDP